MAGFLNTSLTLTHVTQLPEPTTREAAIAMLHNHDLFVRCSPHMKGSESVPTPSPAPEIPAGLTPLAGTKCYRVTDVVHALPAGLWDSDVVSTYEFTDLADGVFVRIRSPMSVLLETVWSINDGGDSEGEDKVEGQEKKPVSGLDMKEEVTIKCSRFLMPVVKSQCDSNWEAIHGKMVAGIKAGPSA